MAGVEVIRLNCKDCHHNGYTVMCDACKKMQTEGRWLWEIDTGNRLIRCPDCGGGMSFNGYRYSNPYKFCPYCGHQMILGEQIKMEGV